MEYKIVTTEDTEADLDHFICYFYFRMLIKKQFRPV